MNHCLFEKKIGFFFLLEFSIKHDQKLSNVSIEASSLTNYEKIFMKKLANSVVVLSVIPKLLKTLIQGKSFTNKNNEKFLEELLLEIFENANKLIDCFCSFKNHELISQKFPLTI